jgi:GH35 family endo-1,4-beta-xylanase
MRRKVKATSLALFLVVLFLSVMSSHSLVRSFAKEEIQSTSSHEDSIAVPSGSPFAAHQEAWLSSQLALEPMLGRDLIESTKDASNSSGEVQIRGVVQDRAGKPVAGAYVGIRDSPDNRQLAATSTSPNGSFKVRTEKADAYIITVTSPSSSEINGVYPRTFILQRNRVPRQGLLEVTVNFNLDPAGNLVLYSYDKNGKLLRNKDWDVPVCYTTDENGLIAMSAYHAAQDDYSAGRDWDYELALPNILIPLGARRTINLLWEAPGFGRVVLIADNGGEGYELDKQGSAQLLLLNFELARTQLHFLNGEFDESKREGYSFSDDLVSKWRAANDALSEASNLKLDQPYRASLSDKALTYSLQASELLEIEKAKQNIETQRKIRVSVRLLDSAGNPIKNTPVRIQQESNDFLFGVFVGGSVYAGSLLDSSLLDLLADARVDYLTLHFNWKATEPSPGWYDSTRLNGAKRLADRGFALKGHAIIWFPYDVLPDYVLKMDFHTLNQSVYTHVFDIVSSTKSSIHCWELNELEIANDVNLTLPQMIEIARTAIMAIRNADSTARINIAFTEPYGQHSRDRYDISNEKPYAYVPFEFIQELLKAGVDFDAIALHMYYGSVYRARDLSSISRVVDWYATFGKPIEISEIETSTTSFDPNMGYWHSDKPSEQLQAEWIAGLYTVLLGNKHVDRISWWSAKDSYAFIEKGGIIDASNQPKEGYFALKKIIESLWTNVETSSDSSGLIVFSGCPGKYLVDVEGYGQAEIVVGSETGIDYLVTPTESLSLTTTAIVTHLPTVTDPGPDVIVLIAIGFVAISVAALSLARMVSRKRRHDTGLRESV